MKIYFRDMMTGYKKNLPNYFFFTPTLGLVNQDKSLAISFLWLYLNFSLVFHSKNPEYNYVIFFPVIAYFQIGNYQQIYISWLFWKFKLWEHQRF